MKLPLGKLHPKVLEERVLRYLGSESEDVVVKPRAGIDFAAIRIGEGYLIVASDPITGAVEEIGWYAANVSMNDVATSGAKPVFLEAVLLLPEGCDEIFVETVAKDLHRATISLGVAIIGGHSEITPGLDRPIVITTSIGYTKRFVTAGGALEGDAIVATKVVAPEGTSILARSYADLLSDLPRKLLEEAVDMGSMISIVREAVSAFETGFVHAMHDPTEGGVIGGLYEMGAASNIGFYAKIDEIPMANPTKLICRRLHVNPYKLISSGMLILAVDPRGLEEVLTRIRALGIEATVAGEFRRGPMVVECMGEIEELREPPVDELWRIFGERSKLE